MDLLQSLKEKGWHLLNDAVQQISDNNAITNFRTLQQKAIDLDLREIGAPAFPEDIQKGKLESIPGNIVVQVQKVRNVSAPKANEESHAAPRMLKIALTDGHTVCQAIEVEQVAALSLNTPPGTKLRLKHETVNMSHGMLLLEQGSVEVLGGRVTHLVDKWELNRSLAKHTRGRIGEEGGPPPWIPFGQKITRTSLADRNFKSLDESRGGANNENKENAEFEAQRQDAIAEAVRGGAGGGARKVFGGGNARSLVDKNVKQIVDAGFTAQQAEQALHANKNNVARALRMLQKKEVNSGNSEGGRGGGGGGGRGRRRGGGGGDKEDDGGGGGGGGGGPKPSGKVSLFDFLEDKLPSQNGKETEPQEQQQQQQQHHNSSHQPHHHQSNRHHEPRNSGGGSRGGGGGGYNRGGGNRRGGGGGGAAEPPPRSRGGGGEDRAQNQKPPRFQNQQRYQQNNDNSSWPTNNTSYSDSYSGYDSYNGGGYGGKMSARGYDDYSETVGQYGGAGGNKQRQQQGGGGGGTQYGGYNDQYRRRYNSNTNVNNYRSSGSNDNYSQQLMDAGMPEIPEFPFKDASSIQPLMSAGFFTASGFLSSSNQQQQQQQQQQAPPPQQQPPPPPTAAPAPLSQYHAPLPSSQPPEQIISYPWKIGEKCMAKYWENNVYYNAEITGLSKNTCVVKFLDYGNYEEVLQDDCIPLLVEGRSHPPLEQSVFNPLHQSQQSNSNHFSGSIEFRRGGTRPFVKSDGGGGGGGAGGGNRRPRGAQQVYVPPAQRGNHPQRK